MKKYLFFLLVFWTACQQKPDTETVLEAGLKNSPKLAEDEIFFTHQQNQLSDIEITKVSLQSLQEPIQASGMLDVPPQNKASVSVPIGGFIKYADKIVGDFVEKGTTIAILEHPDYIKLQQDFLETKSQISFLEKDFQRQKSLQKENIGAEKDFQRSESEYQTAKVRLAALGSQLKMLGINPDNLTAQTLKSTISVTAPISGYVSEIFTEIGKFVSPQDVLVKILDKSHLHLELQVFEKDIFKVQMGQKVRFKVKEWNENFDASIKQIGQNFDVQTRSTNVHAHLSKLDTRFKVGMFIEAQILVGENQTLGVPEEAIVELEGKNYVFVPQKKTKDGTIYKKIVVEKGVSEGGFTAIGGIAENQEIVGKGAFYLKAAHDKAHSDGESGGHAH